MNNEQWWWCEWTADDGYQTHEASEGEFWSVKGREGEVIHAMARMPGAVAPTYEEFRNFVWKSSNWRLPLPEAPRWWMWAFNPDTGWGEWKPLLGGPTEYKHVGNGVWILRLYGTKADRDQKRDKMIEMAREIGGGA